MGDITVTIGTLSYTDDTKKFILLYFFSLGSAYTCN